MCWGSGAGAGHEFSGAPFSLAMAAIAVALFAGEAYQRQAAGEIFDLQAVAAKVMPPIVTILFQTLAFKS